MKIVHICMVAYLDGWGYQDNLLPAYTAKAGHDVVVVTSANHFPTFLKEDEKKKILEKGTDYYDGYVHVYRIHTKYNTTNLTFYCKGVTDILNKEKPNIIFHHDINSSSMLLCWKYVCNHPKVKFFVDNHADRINESKIWLWKFFIIKGLMKFCTKLINSKVSKFYGVTPGRCDYLHDVYGADSNKIALLPIGFDMEAINSVTIPKVDLRQEYGIPLNATVITSGGKMGTDKGTESLIEAFVKLNEENENMALVLFGRFTDEESEKIAKETKGVYVMGWCDRQKTISLLKLSDIACWPIHHTTLIEDAVGCSVPVVIRNTPNTSHLINGNGEYVTNGSTKELIAAINKVIEYYPTYEAKAKIMCLKYTYPNIVKQIEKDSM